MKLATPDWKAAWLEHRVSDRFFQEMARLDKSLVHQLGDTTRWCTQLTMELGSVAQPLQRLESGAPADGELKQAYDRAIRLAALAAHLSVALHEAVSEPTSAARYPLRAAGQHAAETDPEHRGKGVASPTDSDSTHPEPTHQAASRPNPPSPLRMQQASDARAANPASTPHSAAKMQPIGQMEEPEWKDSSMGLPSDFESADAGTLEHTIRSLSDRGLSRGEIEIVTGQPRGMINDVLSQR